MRAWVRARHLRGPWTDVLDGTATGGYECGRDWRFPVRRRSVFTPLLLVTLLPVPARAGLVDLGAPDLAAVARRTPVQEELRVGGVRLEAAGPAAVLELRRVHVFAPGARIVAHGESGATLLPVPGNVYFRGSVSGGPAARVALSVLASGEIRGLLAGSGRYWVLSNVLDGRRLSAPEVRAVDVAALTERFGGFRCDTDALATPGAASHLLGPAPPAGPPSEVPEGGAAVYASTIAVESDFELFSLFGNVPDTVDYMADLIAYASVVYEPEVSTEMLLGDVSVWTTAADPWQETAPFCGLAEFGRYWNDNNQAVLRTVAHFMSGKPTNAGIAWVGVLCSGAFNYDISGQGCSLTPAVDNYGGDYGYSAGIDGDFDLGNPMVVADVFITSHEMGHNFNSPHTHCYNGIGGPDPIDECFGTEPGCYMGPTSLPAGCPGAGQGCGTIMSYCHLLGGLFANISWTFGEGHPFGVDPERAPARMGAAVSAAHASNPQCVPLATGVLFEDGFESGDTSAWDGTVESP